MIPSDIDLRELNPDEAHVARNAVASHRRNLRRVQAQAAFFEAEVVVKTAPRMRIVVAALALAACGAPPALPVPRVPPIPTTAHETWRCAAPGAPTVLVEGTPEPARVEVGDVSLDCRLVPMGR